MNSPWILVSGLVGALLGALIGAGVAWGINWSNRKVAAIERLLALVFPLGVMSDYDQDTRRYGDLWNARYPELWGAYAALAGAVSWWQRRGLEAAWYQYIGVDFYAQMPADEKARLFLHYRPKSQDESVRRNAAFIRYLQALRSTWL